MRAQLRIPHSRADCSRSMCVRTTLSLQRPTAAEISQAATGPRTDATDRRSDRLIAGFSTVGFKPLLFAARVSQTRVFVNIDRAAHLHLQFLLIFLAPARAANPHERSTRKLVCFELVATCPPARLHLQLLQKTALNVQPPAPFVARRRVVVVAASRRRRRGVVAASSSSRRAASS